MQVQSVCFHLIAKTSKKNNMLLIKNSLYFILQIKLRYFLVAIRIIWILKFKEWWRHFSKCIFTYAHGKFIKFSEDVKFMWSKCVDVVIDPNLVLLSSLLFCVLRLINPSWDILIFHKIYLFFPQSYGIIYLFPYLFFLCNLMVSVIFKKYETLYELRARHVCTGATHLKKIFSFDFLRFFDFGSASNWWRCL